MRVLLITLLFLSAGSLIAQKAPTHNREQRIVYHENKDDFPNPERGFYIPIGASAGHFTPLDQATLHRLFSGPHKQGSARYAIHSTLLMREYTLDSFRVKPLSREFLAAVDQDFALAREAGIKLVLRFAYINHTHSGDCPDVYKICPPYGDAPKPIVLQHIAQLTPLLRKNADVIAVLQEGFIGVWGENFYTDYFGDPGKNGPGRVMDSSWKDRNEVLHALLDAMPDNRMVQVRTPQIKQKFVYGPAAPISSTPLTPDQAYTHSYPSRIGFHNDCFLASPDDYGTYYDYGSSSTPQQEANLPLRQYLQQDSRFVAVGGETCDDAYSPQNDCAPAGHAEEEMAAMHYSFLNSAYNNDVNNDWDSLGCIGSIQRRLGYRFVLQEGHFPTTATAGSNFSFTLQLHNAGYASPFNPRPVQLIFRNKATGAETRITAHADPRTWFPGSYKFTDTLTLPRDLPAGNYDLLLALPDKAESIAGRPEYSIRLANDNCWEPRTGYNNLGVSILVAH